MNKQRQLSENWLLPVMNARITCHTIQWSSGPEFETMQTGGDLYFHRIPRTGTMTHAHDFSEILLVTSGAVLHRVNGERQRMPAGTLCFVRPDDLHGFQPDDAFDSCEIVMLDFALELFVALSDYLGNAVFLRQLTEPVLPPCFRLDPATTETLYARLLRLNTPAESPDRRSVKLKILLGELYARFFLDEINLLSGSQIPDWLEDLCTAMRREENYVAGIERMQRLACRTPGHLCKSFRKYLGKSPTEFINELRINHAARLLADTREDILLIAEHLNFKSLSRFYHLFRRYYGVSPAAFRQLHGSRGMDRLRR